MDSRRLPARIGVAGGEPESATQRGPEERDMRAATFTLTCLVVALAIPPATTAADGLPIPGVNTQKGVVSADGALTFTADPGEGRTVVERVDGEGGSIRVEIDGTYVVPGVAIDETTSGLSFDAGTLVLIKPRRSFPQEETEMVVLDAATLAVREEIMLDGDYSFDALSPDGATLFLTEYPNPRDPTNYLIRAFDLATGVMAPDPIVDKSDPDEEMRGFPLTRVTGTGGRWEYTLYDGHGHEPFVHALDTMAAETLCIDLPWVDSRQVYRAELELVSDGATISVIVREDRDNSGPVAAIDTATGEAGPIGPKAMSVSESRDPLGLDPVARDPGPPSDEESDEAGIGSGGLVALGLLAAFLLAGLVRVAVYSRASTSSP